MSFFLCTFAPDLGAMFKPTREEAESSRSQFAMLNDDSISSQNARTSSSSEGKIFIKRDKDVKENEN